MKAFLWRVTRGPGLNNQLADSIQIEPPVSYVADQPAFVEEASASPN